MKRSLIIIAISIACLGVLYIFLTWNGMGNPDYMHHRYNKVITEPLAKLGNANAQFKMGLFWFYGSGADVPNMEEIEQAIYWFEKASENGNNNATKEMQNVLKALEDKNNAYYKAGIYYSMALECLKESSHEAALDYINKAITTLEAQHMQDDDLYQLCLSMKPTIEDLANNTLVKAN